MRVRRLAPWALLLVAACSGPTPGTIEQLTILHVNDLHARLIPDDNGRGGFAYVAEAIRREKREVGNAIVLHAGDMVQGSPVSTLFQGTPAYEVANAMGFDAHCLGNHEFDYGWERIRDFQQASTAPILNANVLGRNSIPLVEPYVVLQAGGLEVAIVGALTPRLPALVKPKLIEHWRAVPLVEAIRPLVAELHENADLIVVLGHLFDDEDEALLREVPLVDVLVSGHDHGGRDTPLEIEGRVGVKLRPYGRELGRLDLSFDTAQGRIVQYAWRRLPVSTDRYNAHAATAKLVAHWEARVSERVDVPLATSERPFDRGEVKTLIERAIRETTRADLAYMNRGGVRDSLPRGALLVRHIWNVLPFDNMLVEASIRGRDVPPQAGGRQELEAEQTYKLVTNDFVGDQWRKQGLELQETGLDLREVFLDWVRTQGTLR